MNKDVIYIDVEDDITAIISKVKASKEKIVALVPPKRIGILQSAVNLRLLSRAAGQAEKRLVVITNNHALASLAAAANLPVARNLQSKPELAPVASPHDDDGEEDVIDGNELPVGDHAGQPAKESDSPSAPYTPSAAMVGASSAAKATKPTKAGRAKSKVPNFNTFRKKLIFGIVAGVLLIAFLVWAIFFAPRATVVVSATTDDNSVNAKVSIGDKLSTDLSKNTIKATKNQKSEKKTVDFEPTGSKNLGEKARGVVQFSTDSISVARNGVTIPAGTIIQANGLNFATDSSVTLTLANSEGSSGVTAAEQGAKYNAASGQVSGAPDGVSASLSSPTSGGTDKVVKIVTAGDVQKARESLADQQNNDAEAQLKSSVKDGTVVDGTYRVDYGDIKSTPAIGAEATSGNATLNTTVTYLLYSVSKDEVGKYLDAYLKKQLGDNSDQRVYDDGRDNPSFQDVTNSADGAALTLVATAKVGPKLDEKDITEKSLGKKTGEIQETLQSIQGIEQVDVNYFPFWVSTVPGDAKKVTVQFKVNE